MSGEDGLSPGEVRDGLRGRDRIIFSPSLPLLPGQSMWESAGEWNGPLQFTVELTDGRKPVRVDLTGLSRPQLAREIMGAYIHQMRQPGMGESEGAVKKRAVAIRKFFEFLDRYEDPHGIVQRVGALEAHHLDKYEEWLRRIHREKSGTPYESISALVSVLAHGQTNLEWAITESLRVRLTYTTEGEKGQTTPWDGWSSAVAAQLRRAARRAVGEVIRRRILAEKILKLGQDPRHNGWRSYPNLLWWIDAHGPLTDRVYRAQVKSTYGQANPLTQLNAALFLTTDDLVAFMILLQLETALPIECLRELRTDCLQNPGGTPSQPTIEIHYTKRRAHGQSKRHERFRDGGSTTPGGIVRWLLRLTEHARRHYTHRAQYQDLWLHTCRGFGLSHLSDTRGTLGHAAQRWIANQGIRGDDGLPLKFNWMQLRKTAWGLLYDRHGALLPIVTRSHTKAVAGRHYAPIGIHEEAHHSALEHAQQDAFAVAFRSQVVPFKEVERLRSCPDEAARELGITPEEVTSILADTCDKDVFFAACKNFENSPFGKPGQGCPEPWNCFDCTNAVIHPRHLPAILIFLDAVLESRDELEQGEWEGTWGKVHHRLNQVLHQFQEGEIAAAREQAQRYRPLLYVPAEMRLGGLG